jgi:hypothetical protein
MFKNISLSLIISLSILGCGSGSSKTVNNYYGYDENIKKREDMPTSTSSKTPIFEENSYEKAPDSLVKNVKDLGYKNIDDSCKIDDEKIAFIHHDNGNREFCIYDKDESEVISRVQNFNGGNIISVVNNNIYFSNNVFVNVSNPWKVEVNSYNSQQSTTSYQPTSSNSVDDILRSRYGSSLIGWHYTYAKGGIFLEIRSGGNVELHLLDSNTLTDEKVLKRYSNPMREIRGLEGGVVRVVYSNGDVILYDYIDDRDLSTEETSHDNSYDYRSLIKNALIKYYTRDGENQFYKIHEIHTIDSSKYIVKCEYTVADYYVALFVVDINSNNSVNLIEIETANLLVGADIKNISVDTSAHSVTYHQKLNAGGYNLVVYDYISLTVIKKVHYDDNSYDQDDSTNYNQNVQTSSNNSDTYSKVSSYLAQLITYKYSQQGGGIFAIGVKDGSYTFYRFSANPIELEKAFYNIPISRSTSINSIEALSNGRFKIDTSSGSYIFNYFSGDFE